MRFMVMVRATRSSEEGCMPDEKLMGDMMKFNEELVKAGVMVAGDGLKPSAEGARVHFSADNKRTLVDGPFAETKELIAGYWIWKVSSREEALAWAKRCPSPFPGEECDIEIRPLYEMDDFGEAVTPEIRAQEARIRQVMESKQ